MIGRNNQSRKNFASFIKKHNLERFDKRNVFVQNGRLWTYSLILSSGENKVRQFYDDVDGAYVQGLGYILRKNFIANGDGSITRIMANYGVRLFFVPARNAIYNPKKATIRCPR